MKKVLAVGSDQTLLESRACILAVGYEASKCSPSQTLERLRGGNVDLLLVCNSIPPAKGTELVSGVKQAFPDLRIVRLLSLDSPSIERPLANRVVFVDFNPKTWLKAVDDLMIDAPDRP